MKKIVLSPLGHTWFIDVDGTICKHNGYKIDGHDTLLPGVKDFFSSIDYSQDKVIIVTSREEKYRDLTESFLKQSGIKYDAILFECPFGERVLINDNKPSGLRMGRLVNLPRDTGLNLVISVDKTK